MKFNIVIIFGTTYSENKRDYELCMGKLEKLHREGSIGIGVKISEGSMLVQSRRFERRAGVWDGVRSERASPKAGRRWGADGRGGDYFVRFRRKELSCLPLFLSFS